MTFAQLVGLFLKHHTQNKSAPNTITFYRVQLGAFRDLLDRDINAIGPQESMLALATAGEGKSTTTQRSRAVAFEQLQKFAVKLGLVQKPWLAVIAKPPANKRTRIPTDAETNAIMSAGSKQFRLIYEALRLSGARPNELCRAEIADYSVNLAGGGVITLNEHKTARKTGRARVIPVGRKLGQIVRLAIGKRKTGPIFVTHRARGWTVKNLSTTFLRLRRKCQLSDDLVLYSARHEAGTRFAREHGILMASRMLGHTTIKTTERYAHTNVDELSAAQDSAAGFAGGKKGCGK